MLNSIQDEHGDIQQHKSDEATDRTGDFFNVKARKSIESEIVKHLYYVCYYHLHSPTSPILMHLSSHFLYASK